MSEFSESILRGLEDALAHAEGRKTGARTTLVYVPPIPDVKRIRQRTGMTQREFAAFFGFKLSALQAWEQGRRKPDHTVRILFRVIEYDPVAVHEALKMPLSEAELSRKGTTKVAAE